MENATKVIDKTVVGKTMPTNPNTLWLDTTEGEKNAVLKYKGNPIAGGGAGSSNPPEADAAKIWQVTPVQKGTKTEEVVIVPEQTLVDGQEFEYNDKFVPGAQCVAVIDGVEYRGEVLIDSKDNYAFVIEDGLLGFDYHPGMETFQFFNNTDFPEVTAKLSVIEEVPNYDYNWAPGVKIPIPTAEDEGKILVVTKVEGDNTSTIVPEQEVPADNQTPLTDVDLKYFVLGNTVTATVTITEQDAQGEPEGGEIIAKGPKSSNSETIVVSGIIEQKEDIAGVIFNEGQEDVFSIRKVPYIEPEDPKSINTKSSTDTEYILVTNLCDLFGGDIEPTRGNTIPYATIKLEYGESNYEYQLQENSGSGSGCNCGGFKYNELPEPAQFRDPTQEELNKYQENHPSLYKVLDLKDGIVPDKLILSSNDADYKIFNLCGYNKITEIDEIGVDYIMFSGGQMIPLSYTFMDGSDYLIFISVSSDGSLILVDRTNSPFIDPQL